MALLMLFALLAGAGTALSPCVVPVLPAVLGAGATGGRRRPLGVVTGLVLSFTFTAVALVYVIDALGLPNDLVRTLAIATLLGFGIALLVPALGDRIEAFGSRLAPAPARVRGEGFGSGLALGAGLGFVYTPCAGPILAGVITVSAAQEFTAGKLAVALAYALGSGLVLYALMLGGRRLAAGLGRRRSWVQAGMGAAMVAVAVAMVLELDLEFQSAIADDLPAVLVNPTGELEESGAVAAELSALSGHGGATEGGASQADAGSRLPDYGLAPDFVVPGQWFNTDGRELSISSLTEDEGRVVLIDFWTYTCVNCIRTLPQLRAWDDAYRDDGLTIVGVHAPEFAFERDAGNVADAIERFGIEYPVVQDNEFGTWNAFANRYWPAKYLIDADGHVRYVHFGEGAYETTERAIRSLLAEAGAGGLGGKAEAETETADPRLRTPETYLGFERAQGWVNGPRAGGALYRAPDPKALGLNEFAWGGRWRVGPESATAREDATISLGFEARRVFLVLGSAGAPRELEVKLDGRPLPDSLAGEDVRGSRATIGEQRLYRLVELPEAGRHTLELELEPGISGYAFTFG